MPMFLASSAARFLIRTVGPDSPMCAHGDGQGMENEEKIDSPEMKSFFSVRILACIGVVLQLGKWVESSPDSLNPCTGYRSWSAHL